MPNYTENLNLEKPLRSEQYNIDVFNANAEKIDQFAGQTPVRALTADVLTTGAKINGVNFKGNADIVTGAGFYYDTVTYAEGDLAFIYNQDDALELYRSLQDGNIGNNPLTTTGYWQKENLGSCANTDLSNLTVVGEAKFANPSLSNLTTLSNNAHFKVLKPTLHSRMRLITSGVVAQWGSRKYYKAYDDECFGAVTIDTNGYGSICLVSETERGATGYDDYDTTPRTNGTFTYYGKTFYYYISGYAMPSSEGLIKTSNVPVTA